MAKKPLPKVSTEPPALGQPIDTKAADAFVNAAAVHVAPQSAPAASVAQPPSIAESPTKAAGRPRKYDQPLKPLTIRVPLDCYEGLRFLEYVERRGSIQEVAADMLVEAVQQRVAEHKGKPA